MVPSFYCPIPTMNTEDRLRALLAEKITEEEFADCYLLSLTISAARKVEVVMDCDSGFGFDKCRQISRYLEGYLDEEGWLGEKYTLEVSSPGVDRPLELHRQYVKNVGRELAVTLQDGTQYTGKLTEVNDQDLVLEYKERRKEGNRKKTVTETPRIAFADIAQAKVQISFSK